MNSKLITLLVFITIVIASFVHYSSKEILDVISWDVYGYYLYLPAIFKYHDISQFGFTLQHLENYRISADIYQIYHLDDLRSAPLYTIGMAILYSPFYFLADIIANLTSYETDGMSKPYQWSIVLCCWTYIAIGLYYARKTLKLLAFKEEVICVALVSIYLGTNFFHYASFVTGMPHAYLFTLYIALIYHTIKWHEKPSYKTTSIIAILIALLCLCRPSEAISILIPLLYGIKSFKDIPKKFKFVFENRKHVLLLSLIGFSLVSVQVVFWKLGHDGLFSFRKGWFLYTPIAFLSLLGFFFRRYFSKLHLGLLIFILLNVYIIFSWHIWWYASSFGARAVIQSYPILLISLAALIGFLIDKKILKYGLYFLLFLFICLNQFQDWQYRNRILLQDGTTSTYYKSTFFNTKFDKMLRKYVDSNEKRPLTMNFDDKETIDLVKLDTLADKIISGKYGPDIVIDITAENIEKYRSQWLDVESTLLYKGDLFDQYRGAKLIITTRRNDKHLKWVGVRVQRLFEENETKTINFDYQVPDEIQIGDKIECVLWNNGPDIISMESMKLSLFQN